jgi:RsiW-degrading membrane proteinase PrsW (M82 family)
MPPLAELTTTVLVALLPVLAFLAALHALDSFKLLPVRSVLLTLLAGAALAAAAYVINGLLLRAGGWPLSVHALTWAPVVEEALKAAVIVLLVLRHRIGFLVDAAVLGFAVGSGFALAENAYYLQAAQGAGLGTWIVRGFGTAVMHGGTTALCAVLMLARVETREHARAADVLPGLALAVALHAGFNALRAQPLIATAAVLVVLPPLALWVYERSERSLRQWMGDGFDADAELLALLNSGRFAESPAGRYLASLRRTLAGALAADALCYLRLYTELALRAKGVLMMRENGFDVPALDAETRAKFDELRWLEASIGPTGLRALRPLLRLRHRELWQLYMLEAGSP